MRVIIIDTENVCITREVIVRIETADLVLDDSGNILKNTGDHNVEYIG